MFFVKGLKNHGVLLEQCSEFVESVDYIRLAPRASL